MSITTQPTVNVLNGSLACAFNDGRPTGSNELVPSIVGNFLKNPTFNVAESAPPVYDSFAGDIYFGEWGHFGQLFTNNFDYKTNSATRYLANFPAFKDLGGTNLDDQPKVIKIFGTGTNFPDNTGDKVNTDNSRTYPSPPLVGFSDSVPAGTFPDSDAWCRHEWSQGVVVPDSATTVKFGAYIKTPSDDLFRNLNCGGVYIWQDASSTKYINAIVVKKPTDTINLVTGLQATGLNSIQQWSGLSDTNDGSTYALRWNDTTNIQSIDYESTNNHQQFRKVDKEVTLQTGTGRRLGLAMFFGENQGNLDESATPTGSIQFYNPFVQFFDSSGNLIMPVSEATLVLKHTGYGSARITIGGTTLNYDGTEGTNFPDLITSTDTFTATFRAIGSGAIFDGNPSITGGTYTGDIDESEDGDLNITWDGVSGEIVITTDAIQD